MSTVPSTGHAFPSDLCEDVLHGVDELAWVGSGLEETMIKAFHIRNPCRSLRFALC